MLVERSFEVRILFIGLWTLADREGRVENRPKRIKLELFPYDDVDVSSMLNELAEDGFVRIYECAGKKVVQIENFLKHQTPHGTEKDSELPDENGEYTVHERTDKGYVTGKKRINSTAQQNDNGKLTLNERNDSVGAEGVNTLNPDVLNPDNLNQEKEKHSPEKQARFDFKAALVLAGVDPNVAADYITTRKAKKCVQTETAFNLLSAESSKAGLSVADAVAICCKRGWGGFDASWIKPEDKSSVVGDGRTEHQRMSDAMLAVTGTRNFL